MNARRLSASEIDTIMDRKRAEMLLAAGLPRCSGYGCNQGRSACDCPTSGASAVSGIEHEPPYNVTNKPRMGRLSLAERVLLSRRPTYTWAAVLALAVACFVVWVRA